MGDVTALLSAASAGDRSAADQAFALVYSDLQTLARAHAPARVITAEIRIGPPSNRRTLLAQVGAELQASAEEFAKRANAKLAGKAKVVVYGSSQLGGDKELLQKLKLGTVDMALPSTVMSNESDMFGIFEMPDLVKDREHMKRIEKELFW